MNHRTPQAQRPLYIFSAWADQPTPIYCLNDDRFRVASKAIDVCSSENSDPESLEVFIFPGELQRYHFYLPVHEFASPGRLRREQLDWDELGMSRPGADLKLQLPEVSGRGVVICAGGPYTQLALVTIRLLREVSSLPVEVWHLPHEAGELQSVAWPQKCQLRQVPVALPRRRPEVWAVKPLALLGSRFREVLLLDADNLPVLDPEVLFDEPSYQANGALFWPDLAPFQEKMPEQWSALSGGVWQSRPENIRWEQESGQLLVDKAKCGAMLQRAATMAMHLRSLCRFLPGDGGDKDLFQLAWTLESRSFAMAPLPAAAGCLNPERASMASGAFVGHTMVHHSCDGTPYFLHRTIDKHEDLWQLHWEVVAKAKFQDMQCLSLQRICPDAKVKARIVPQHAEHVEVQDFDRYVGPEIRTRFARIVAELREEENRSTGAKWDDLPALLTAYKRVPALIDSTHTLCSPRGHRMVWKAMSVSKGESTVQKALLLFVLVLQNCACAILVKQSRTHSADWVPQTGVILQEMLKGITSLVLAVLMGESMQGALDPIELLQSSVPALLYLVQNNLQYVALATLEPATYTVTYQLKILSTAVCFVLILGRKLTLQRWLSLGLLVLGVVLVQLATFKEDGSSSQRATGWGGQIAGLIATVISASISGLAGVYTEKILKGSKVTLWVRNVQLASWSALIGVLGLAGTGDLSGVWSNGFFHGYNGWIWASACNNAFGGLLIAAVIKYADNILKNFATSVSIVLTTALSIQYFGLELTMTFLTGVVLVCYSIFLYGQIPIFFRTKAC
eukprot:s135_g28.t1